MPLHVEIYLKIYWTIGLKIDQEIHPVPLSQTITFLPCESIFPLFNLWKQAICIFYIADVYTSIIYPCTFLLNLINNPNLPERDVQRAFIANSALCSVSNCSASISTLTHSTCPAISFAFVATDNFALSQPALPAFLTLAECLRHLSKQIP